MPDSFIALPPDSTGKKTRTRQRTVGANVVEEQYVIPLSERLVHNTVMVSTFRTQGAAALTQNLLTIENGVGSGRLVGLRRISVQLDTTAALAAVAPTIEFRRTTALPTGGTVLQETQWDTTATNSGLIVARGATASHGGALTPITATGTTGSAGWSQFTMRQATVAGQVVMDDQSVIPQLASDTPIILREGQAIVVQAIAAATTSNPATNFWIVNAVFDGYTVP